MVVSSWYVTYGVPMTTRHTNIALTLELGSWMFLAYWSALEAADQIYDPYRGFWKKEEEC